MDMLMDSQSLENGVPSDWDFHLEDGLSMALFDKVETAQRAAIACFIERGSIPAIEQAGVQWPEYLTGTVEARELDAQMRLAIRALTGGVEFVPFYYEKDGRLRVTVQGVENGN